MSKELLRFPLPIVYHLFEEVFGHSFHVSYEVYTQLQGFIQCCVT